MTTQPKNAQAVNEPQKPLFNTIPELEEFAKTAPITLMALEAPQMVDEEGKLLDPDAKPEFMVGLGVILPNNSLVGGIMAYNQLFDTVEEAAAIAKAISEGKAELIDQSLLSEYVISFHLTPSEPKLDIRTAQYVIELEGSLEIGDFALNHLSVPVCLFGAGFPDAIKAKQQYDIFKKNHEAYLAHIEKRRAEAVVKLQADTQEAVDNALAAAHNAEDKILNSIADERLENPKRVKVDTKNL